MKPITDSYFFTSEKELTEDFQNAFESWARSVGSEYSTELQQELILRLNQTYKSLADAILLLDGETAKGLAHRFTGLYMFSCHRSDEKTAAKRLEVYLNCSDWRRSQKCMTQLRSELDCLEKAAQIATGGLQKNSLIKKDH
jgi:hypothetical protein